MTDAETKPTSENRTLLIAQMREAYGRAAYTHKTHEKQADLCFQSHRRQKRLLIILTVISSGTFLSSLLGIIADKSWAALITSFIALCVTAINLGTKTFKYGEETQKHRDTAARVWNLRESYQSLIVDLLSETLTLDEGRSERDRLQQGALEIYGDAPRTTPTAYTKAQDALKNREDLTFSEQELDLLLPAALRIRNEG